MELQDTNSFCLSQNVTYEHRVYDPDSLNWCPVPGGGADALLFAGLAVFCSCALYSKLSAVWVLLAGALFQVANVYLNMNHFSNALTIWLGMHPSAIFFQIFLPPLLLDSAVRVDFFLFKKVSARARDSRNTQLVHTRGCCCSQPRALHQPHQFLAPAHTSTRIPASTHPRNPQHTLLQL
eukprot:GHRQ01020212.1.p2 GENE.GHRQ01020212.1~~GHRQ01020212.1.p2  ORF type:complete len:180 (+),score=69.88 GHRQ01020212.1:283-822(+)